MYEIHTLDDGTMVKAVPETYGCKGCFFDGTYCTRHEAVTGARCSRQGRKDNQSAVFKRHIRLAVEVKE